MNDQDYIKAGVELADGFELSGNLSFRLQEADQFSVHAPRDDSPQWFLDTLAAQLTRQYHERHPDDTVVYHDDVMETLKYVLERY